MRLVVAVSQEQKAKLRDSKTISNAMSAVLLGKQQEIVGKPLYWEDRDSDEIFPFLLHPSTGDTTILVNVKNEAADMLADLSTRCKTTPEELVAIGIMTYFGGLEKSKHCDLILKQTEEGFVRIETGIFPKTRS
ncbi:MAG TPA: hypothetical protein VFX17_00800 [Patescibacteria group bacterium]|nr:hypothetical protein [Patescibacteria group bacterium]